MELTREQRQRIDENRAMAQARLRQTRSMAGENSGSASTSTPSAAAASGARVSGREDQAGATVTKDSASGRDDADEDGRVNHTERPPEVAHGSRSGEGRARGTRAGGGGCARGKVALGGASGGDKACKSNGATVAGGPAGGPAAAACEGCGVEEEATPVDRELLEGFGVSVCRACKLSREQYQCVTKKEAKDHYLLPEGTILVLKFIERDNPHHSSWTKMKLYLRRDVMGYSYKRWGDEAGLEAERRRRDALKFDRSLAKTKNIFKRAKSSHDEGRRRSGGLADDDE